MSFNTNLMYIQMPPLRRPKVPVTSSPPRALGTTRGLMGRKDTFEFQRSHSDAKRKHDDVKKTSTSSLRLKDIARLDLMSPYAVQRLTGNYRSSFPTVAGTPPGHVKLNIQMPSNPYDALPKLALTKVTTGNDVNDARASLSRNLTRSHSEMSHFRPRDQTEQDRPHTEGRLTRSRAQETQGSPFSALKPVAVEGSSLRHSVALTDTKSKENDTCDDGGGNDVNESSPLRVMTRLRSRQRYAPRHQRVVSASSRVTRAERMADLTMSEYTEVHANNRRIDGQVWGGVKPKTAPENGARSVRFNTTNDVFEYSP